jgi:phage terminase small subunit
VGKARDSGREKAFEIFRGHNGNIDLVKIAEILDKPPGTIRGWKNKYRLEERLIKVQDIA